MGWTDARLLDARRCGRDAAAHVPLSAPRYSPIFFEYSVMVASALTSVPAEGV
ncbi:hypothetical protein [Actinomadura meridiana]|uniref:hypothetical protein n=1 Tax=Actinomadura meridiana TaxID=559626 RepID=UPI0031EEBBA6